MYSELPPAKKQDQPPPAKRAKLEKEQLAITNEPVNDPFGFDKVVEEEAQAEIANEKKEEPSPVVEVDKITMLKGALMKLKVFAVLYNLFFCHFTINVGRRQEAC
jgi:hypothetical protein